ncbi:MAG: AbrB/MazE/SpoVT family DNA-binding domain-containing protein [Oscillospiraceae bacterium]|nr:AbrB/MazE/SpoVT family DNA-binding domain-containing protein [Oscillospiraceae bacterium]
METAVKGGNPMNRKTIRISEKRQLTIPQKFFEALGFSTEAECILRGNEIVLRPVREQGGGEFAEQILADLIAQGFSGDQLLTEFKKMQRKVRPAVEAMLTQAEQAARGESESSSYEDVFGTEEE